MTLRTLTFDPAQYKLVPVEPVTNMQMGFAYADAAGRPFSHDGYAAMLAAVPDTLPGVIEHSGESVPGYCLVVFDETDDDGAVPNPIVIESDRAASWPEPGFKKSHVQDLFTHAAPAPLDVLGIAMMVAEASYKAGCGNDRSLPTDLLRSIVDEVIGAPAQPVERQELSDAADDVLAERRRQISVEGWTPEHDDRNPPGDMARAAACYVLSASGYTSGRVGALNLWPWVPSWWKPSAPRRDLVKAGALILAEIERLDRAAINKDRGRA